MSKQCVIHVVVVNYRSAKELRACLLSLRPTQVATITILDNASGPWELDQLRLMERSDARLRVFSNEENVGFGAGVNQAVILADPGPNDYIWILNPDTTVEPDCPRLLAAALQQGADMVSPLILTGEPQLVWFAGGWVDIRRGVSWHFQEGDAPPPLTGSKPVSTSFITGAAPMITASAWQTLGGFREDLFLYWEDADLSRRALDSGLVLQVIPDARVWHAQGASSSAGLGGHGPAFYYYNQRNRILVCGPHVGAWRLVTLTGLRETLRLLVKPILLEPSGRLGKLSASMRGLRDGLAGRTGRGFGSP